MSVSLNEVVRGLSLLLLASSYGMINMVVIVVYVTRVIMTSGDICKLTAAVLLSSQKYLIATM